MSITYKIIFFLSILIIVLTGYLIFIYPAKINQFVIFNGNCSYQTDVCTVLNFNYKVVEGDANSIPVYKIIDNIKEAETTIIFYQIKEVNISLLYDQIINNPLIEKIDYHLQKNDLIISIKRKDAFTPTEVLIKAGVIYIRLPEDNKEYPKFSDFQPKNDSVVMPNLQTISIRVDLKSELNKVYAFFQDKAVDIETKLINNYSYLLEFKEELQEDTDYYSRIVVIDNQERASAISWQFRAEAPKPKSGLGKDRFKYLGWWGQINTDKIAVQKEPNYKSSQLGTLSTINRVKILEEVYGEKVGKNSVWYKIDGGAFPGAYVFSDYINPIPQPQPPYEVIIPSQVEINQYWIDVDLNKKVLTLFNYDQAEFVTYVATGRASNQTVSGTYKIWLKQKKDRMRGGPPVVSYYYDLPNVPFVLYYYGSYALHGTYWHDKFGTQQSAGCTNLTQGDAEFIFNKVLPILPEGKDFIQETGSIVYNHY